MVGGDSEMVISSSSMRRVLAGFLLLVALSASTAQGAVDEAGVRAMITPLQTLDRAGIERLRAQGPAVLAPLVEIYRKSSEPDRALVAWIFYSLGWKSKEAKAALLKDIGSHNQRLRMQVQYALGRVSDDPDVVWTLARIMRNDSDAVLRDKAACALAYDQIHLTEREKVQLFTLLIGGLDDSKPQVRTIAIQALQIHTGQTKGFAPEASKEQRDAAIATWKRWLAEYEKNL
jgi:HEAT repeat protein